MENKDHILWNRNEYKDMVIYFLDHMAGFLYNILLVPTFHHQILEWSDELSTYDSMDCITVTDSYKVQIVSY